MAVGTEGHNLPELFDAVEEIFLPFATKAMALSLAHLQGIVSPYPAQPDRGRGKHFNTYVRGVGFYPRSAFIQDDNEAGGYRVKKRTKKTSIRFTSQQMDKRYVHIVRPIGSGVEGVLLNMAIYSGYVIGSKNGAETPHQAPYHAETGWPNKDDSLAQAMPFINDQCEAAIDQTMARIAAGAK